MDSHRVMMGGAAAAPTPLMHRRRGMMMHMTFFWGDNAEVLFDGWPGRRGAVMYAASLAFVFVLAALAELISNCQLIKRGTHHVTAGWVRTLLHTLRIGLANLVMLAVMSFNGGVFLAAVFGHAVGYLLFGSGVFMKKQSGSDQQKQVDGSKLRYLGLDRDSDLPPLPCC